ncbi:MAG: hypothetical protein ACRCV0_04485 [Brevinema sp.]
MRILLLVGLFLSVHIYGEETTIFDPQLNNTSWISKDFDVFEFMDLLHRDDIEDLKDEIDPKNLKDNTIHIMMEFNDQFFIFKVYLKEKLQYISAIKISSLQKINNLYFLYAEDDSIPWLLEINNDLLYVYLINTDNTNIITVELKQHTKESAQ